MNGAPGNSDGEGYPQSLLNEKIPRSGNKNPVNFCIKKKRKIPSVQCQENIRLCRERRDQNWFVFGCSQEQWSFCGERIRKPLDADLQVLPVRGSLRIELGEVFYGLCAAVDRRNEIPSALLSDLGDEAG